MIIKNTLVLGILAAAISSANAATFVIEKNGYDFSIDGNGGAQQGQQIYLWGTNLDNANQQWVQISHGDGYYSYKKQGTSLCWDGGEGGARRQAVTLETCDSTNYDQHWAKVKVTSGTETYRIEKRNASGFSIDGNGGAAERQSIYLWNSNSDNVNQQWNLNNIESESTSSDGELAITEVFDDGSGHSSYPASNVIDGNTAWSSRWAAQAGGDAVNLTTQLAQTQAVEKVGIAWGQGASRAHTFEIYARAGTSGTWNKVYDSVSSGTSSDIELYDITDISAQQVRVKTFDNTTGSDWTNITEVKLYGSDSDTTTPPTGSLDDWDWSVWDIEGHDPTVGDTMVFDALVAQHITPNGNGWRHELKIKEENRVAMTNVYENFQANIHLNLSDGSKTIVAQHHASDTGTIMKLYVSDTSESGFNDSIANNGIFDVYVRLAKEDGSGEEKKALGTAVSGDSFDFQVINDHGYVTVSAMGETFSLTIEDSSESYLKFGNYLQAQDAETGDDVESSDDFGQFYIDAGITDSILTFSNLSYTRNVD